MSEKNESRTQAIRGYVDGKIQWLWGLPENQRRAELVKAAPGHRTCTRGASRPVGRPFAGDACELLRHKWPLP